MQDATCDDDSAESGIYLLPQLDGADTEDVEKYRPGGFHPVHIMDRYNQFQIVHKLGAGGFATVWLARDWSRERWVALKICQAKESATIETRVKTSRSILARLGCENDTRFVLYEDYFYLTGPNGKHLSLILPVLGPSLSQLSRYLDSRIHPHEARRVNLQVVEAVRDLHSKGICHGDLTPANIVFRLQNISHFNLDDIYRLFGRPRTAPLETERGDSPGPEAPRYIVAPLNFTDADINLLSDDISLIDFDQSFLASSPPEKMLGTPAEYMAPEITCGFPPSTASDIWALGEVFLRIRSGAGIIAAADVWTPCDALFYTMLYIGNPPSSWQRLFDENGWPTSDATNGERLREVNEEEKLSLEQWIQREIWDLSAVQALVADDTFNERAVQDVGDFERDEAVEGASRRRGSNSSYPECFKDRFWKPAALKVRGTYLNGYGPETDPILEALPKISEAEANLFYDLVSKIFVYDPAERATAADLAAHPWFFMDLRGEGGAETVE